MTRVLTKEVYEDARIENAHQSLQPKKKNNTSQHNHKSDSAKAELYLCHTKLKQLAKISTKGTSNIITSITKEYSNFEVINISNRKTMVFLTNRVRNKNTKDFIPSLPGIPSSLRTNHRNKEFMRYDSHNHNDTQRKRFVIFFSDIQHKFLKKKRYVVY
ncbi:hypothetical protein CDIK_3343 [Cucumispora dikerogammari]|nr:hypothetical protein CDIK_3343 [Cucumispora dikerogammari]